MIFQTTSSAANLKQQRIVGGTQATSSEYPWAVLLSSSNSTSDFFCGASLIAERWVLTAAHCVVDSMPAGVVAFVGEYDKTLSTVSPNAITKIIVHPEYDAYSSNNDIALLKLSNAESITPVSLISSSLAVALEAVADDSVSDVAVIGWGDTEDPMSGSYPDILREVDLPYISNTVCNQSQYLNGQVTTNMMCAGLPEGGIDSCQGDSGGAMVYSDSGSWYQAGIVSWGYGCADPNSFGVYTRVENYLDWIASNTSGLGVSSINYTPIVSGHSIEQVLTITNNSSATATIQSKVFNSGTELSIINDQCTILATDESCTLTVVYEPITVGNLTDVLVITSNIIGYPTAQAQINGVSLNEVPVNPLVGNPQPALTWGSGASVSWKQELLTGTEGESSISSGDIGDNEISLLVAHVSLAEEKVLYFDWKVSSELNFDFVELLLDGERIDAVSGNVLWQQNSVSVPAGEHILHWRYRKDVTITEGEDKAWLDNLSWDTPSAMQIFGETLTNLSYQVLYGEFIVGEPGLSWSTSIENPWDATDAEFTQGGSSLVSGFLNDGEQSIVRALVVLNSQKDFSFDIKVSSEELADKVSFYLDGQKQFEMSGEQGWANYQYSLAPGYHNFSWVYSKNDASAVGRDRVWLDNVKLSEPPQENDDGGGSISLYGLFVLFLYAYMNLMVRKKRIN